MRLKTNLIIGIIFSVLAAFVYFYEIRGGEERKAEADKAKELADFAESEVRRLTIDRIDTLIVLEKVQDRWWLKAPVECEADQEAVDRYLRNLRECERDKVVEEADKVRDDPGLAQKYRLHAPRLKVAVETASGSIDTIWWGADSPTERFVYVQQRGDNPEIFTVQAWRYDNLAKGLFDLRDRRVLAFEPAAVRELRLNRPQERVALALAEGWRLLAPAPAPADEQAVKDLLDRLHQARIESIAAESAPPSQYGLDAPSVEVSLLLGDERAEKRLRVGAPAPGGEYYAQDLSRPAVFTLDSTLVRELGQPAAALRNRKPLVFAADQVDHIELQGPGQMLAAVVDTAGTWSLEAPQRGPAKSWKFSNLLSQLAGVEVEEFAGPAPAGQYGLDHPRLRVVLRAGSQTVLEVKLGERGGQVYLSRSGDPEVYRVAPSLLKDLDLQLGDVVQSPATEAPPAGQ
ncbi:MAG: DUF4340 domain-containing protein [Candidatus Handelsmanbacteria bacterium]|nr:DUF4340 domain-containing protein [Candidatus Handelsmanbacteria bacterium]